MCHLAVFPYSVIGKQSHTLDTTVSSVVWVLFLLVVAVPSSFGNNASLCVYAAPASVAPRSLAGAAYTQAVLTRLVRRAHRSQSAPFPSLIVRPLVHWNRP